MPELGMLRLARSGSLHLSLKHLSQERKLKWSGVGVCVCVHTPASCKLKGYRSEVEAAWAHEKEFILQ